VASLEHRLVVDMLEEVSGHLTKKMQQTNNLTSYGY
jgi:hypothetical protein